MKKYSIALPLTDNEGNCLKWLHKTLEENILNYFSGFSVVNLYGAWKDGSTVYRENSKRYDVLTDDSEADARFEGMAKALAYCGKQECILVESIDCGATFVEAS